MTRGVSWSSPWLLLFTKEHEELRRLDEGMKQTTESCSTQPTASSVTCI